MRLRLLLLGLGMALVSCGPSSPESAAVAEESATKSKTEIPPPAARESLAAKTQSPAPRATSNGPAIQPGGKYSGLPSEERIREITRWLKPEPNGFGKPITDRAAWAAFPNRDVAMALAERDLNEVTPEITDDLFLIYSRTGSRKEYDGPYQRRTKRLADFVLAECIEDKGRFLPAIEKELAAILSERTWTLPYHDNKSESFQGNPVVDLGAAMRSWNLATVDYLLGARLQPEMREKIRQEVFRRVLQPYKDQVLGKNTGRANFITWDSNWNAVCHAGVIGSALALVPPAEERAWYLAAAEIYIRNYLAGFTADGYCSEGIGYWNYGFGHYVLMAEAIGDATNWKLDLYQPEIVRNIFLFPSRIQLFPDLNPAFSDNDPSSKASRWIFSVAGGRIPGEISTGERVTVSGVASHPLAALLYETMLLGFADIPEKTAGPQKEIPLRDRFRDAGIAVCRPVNAASGKGLAIAIKAGNNNEHHNHNDIGSFVIALGTKTPLLDPGSEVYTGRTFSPRRYDSKVLNSYGHSVPVVAGKLQDTGAAARGTITAVESTDEADTFLLDLAPAYARSVPSLKKLTRRMKYKRAPQSTIEITDEAEFDSAQSFEDALITFGKCQRMDDSTLVIYDGSEALRVKIDTGGRPFSVRDEMLEEQLPSGRKARRIGISLNDPAPQVRIAYQIEPTTSPVAKNLVIAKTAGEARLPKWGNATYAEAEKFAVQTGGTVELTGKFGATGGTAIRQWNHDGHELTWKFRLLEPGSYGILLRYCNGGISDALRTLFIDGSPADGIQGGFAFPPTSGWSSDRDDWKEAWLAQSGRAYVVSFGSGEHTVSLRNVEVGPVTLDWIALVPLGK